MDTKGPNSWDELIGAEGGAGVTWCCGEDPGHVDDPRDAPWLAIAPADAGDVPGVLAVEEAAWPATEDAMQAEADTFYGRAAQDCLLAATYHGPGAHDGAVVGSISYQQAAWTDAGTVDELLAAHADGGVDWDAAVGEYGLPADWYAATDGGTIAGTHDPGSDVGFLIGVGVHPDLQGQGIAGHLLDAALAELAGAGCAHVLGYARVPGYHAVDAPIGDYVESGEDPVVGFHESNGATVVCPIPGAMPDDADSEGYGALVAYDPAVSGYDPGAPYTAGLEG